jgi:hypothetical protein
MRVSNALSVPGSSLLAMSRFALMLCFASNACHRASPARRGRVVDAGVGGAPSSSALVSRSLAEPRATCMENPVGSAARAIAPAMGLSFEADSATIRVTEESRLVFYDARSLQERRTLPFPGGSRLSDQGDVLLVGDDRHYWIGHVASGRFSDPIEAPGPGQVQISASGSLLAVRQQSDQELVLSIFDTKGRHWRRIAARAPAVGPVNFCGLSERRALWCPVHALGPLYQDLFSGLLVGSDPMIETPASSWRSVLERATVGKDDPTSGDRSGARDRIRILGPGPSRWADDVVDHPASAVLTCHASNRALVLRGSTRQIELRTLPEWRLVRGWSAAAASIACSADGQRVAWVSTCDGKSTLVSVAAQ